MPGNIIDPDQPCKIGMCKSNGVVDFITTEDCEHETCEDGKEWTTCGGCERTCSSQDWVCDKMTCIPGCYCSEDKLWDGTRCVLPEECTCLTPDGTLMADGESWIDGCNKCECESGSLNCYEVLYTLYYLCDTTDKS